MKQFGRICVLDDERMDEHLYFAGKVVILFGLVPNPELTWPGNKDMRDYCDQQKSTLVSLGLLDDMVCAHLEMSRGAEEFATEFADLETAKATFEKMKVAGIVDIYLYNDGELVDSYD